MFPFRFHGWRGELQLLLRLRVGLDEVFPRRTIHVPRQGVSIPLEFAAPGHAGALLDCFLPGSGVALDAHHVVRQVALGLAARHHLAHGFLDGTLELVRQVVAGRIFPLPVEPRRSRAHEGGCLLDDFRLALPGKRGLQGIQRDIALDLVLHPHIEVVEVRDGHLQPVCRGELAHRGAVLVGAVAIGSTADALHCRIAGHHEISSLVERSDDGLLAVEDALHDRGLAGIARGMT